MAAQKFEKDSEEWKMFMDFWQLCQRYWMPDATEEYWQALTDDTKEFYRKHPGTFARELGNALHIEMDRRINGKETFYGRR